MDSVARHRRRGPSPDRVQGSGLVAAGLPDPGQGHQAGRERGGIGELAAQGNACGDMPERGVELIALVGILAQVDVGGTGGRSRRPSGRRGDLQRPAAGPDRRVQPALSPLGLAEDMADPGGEEALAGGRTLADGRREQSLGFGRPTSQPLGHARVPPDDGAEHRFAFAPGGHGP